MAGGGVAVEVEGAGRLQDPVEFDEARGHHREVGHHRGGFEELLQRLDQFDDAGVGALGKELMIGGVHVGSPFPRIGEGVELGLAVRAAGFLEQDVVVGVGVEGRVEVFEVHAGIREDVLVAQPTEFVAKQQPVHGGGV
jgi:hypothetical protein